jgi:hypothetical protein
VTFQISKKSFFYIYIYLNKNWKINWSKQSFTGLGPENRCSLWGLRHTTNECHAMEKTAVVTFDRVSKKLQLYVSITKDYIQRQLSLRTNESWNPQRFGVKLLSILLSSPVITMFSLSIIYFLPTYSTG